MNGSGSVRHLSAEEPADKPERALEQSLSQSWLQAGSIVVDLDLNFVFVYV